MPRLIALSLVIFALTTASVTAAGASASSAPSLVQSPCTDGFVADEFFPATEPMALRTVKIEHRYTLYSLGGQTYDQKIAGGAKFGSFQFSLTVTTHGTASGSMHYSAQTASGTCDSGTVRIFAKRKK